MLQWTEYSEWIRKEYIPLTSNHSGSFQDCSIVNRWQNIIINNNHDSPKRKKGEKKNYMTEKEQITPEHQSSLSPLSKNGRKKEWKNNNKKERWRPEGHPQPPKCMKYVWSWRPEEFERIEYICTWNIVK